MTSYSRRPYRHGRRAAKGHAPPRFHVITVGDEGGVLVGIESLAILAGEADSKDIAEALEWAKDPENRETLRRLWQEYSE